MGNLDKADGLFSDASGRGRALLRPAEYSVFTEIFGKFAASQRGEWASAYTVTSVCASGFAEGFSQISAACCGLSGASRQLPFQGGFKRFYSVCHPADSSPPVPSAYRSRSVPPFGRHAAACAAGRSGAGVEVPE